MRRSWPRKPRVLRSWATLNCSGGAKGNVRVIGITGTNGKSTTTALTGHILKEAQMPSAVGGNIGEAILTLPDLPAASTYVIEMSSYQIDLCPTFTPDIAVHINFSPDHLDRHGSMDGYVAAKERMFRGKGTAIIGVDDMWSHAMCERVKRAGTRKVIPVSCLKAHPDASRCHRTVFCTTSRPRSSTSRPARI